jgi:predicted kinase
MPISLNNTRSLILLRGLPGSGKSTLALVLSEEGRYPVHSIDSYFTNPQTGEYVFAFDKNHLAYAQCEQQTRNSMLQGVEKIFVDNTFTLDWEMEPYFKLAAEFNYRLFVITVENYHGQPNIHGTTPDQLSKMAEKYKVKLM